MNIKGVFQIWTRDGGYHEVPLKEAHAWTREGCKACPDFAAEHADISTGGIGAFADWTLTIVRTARGRDLLAAMAAAGAIETRPIADDPGAVPLLAKLSACQPPPLARGAGRRRPGGSPSSRAEPGARRAGAQAPSSRARASTASNIAGVNSPVKTFRWLGWYEQSSVRAGPPPGAGPSASSSPWANFGRRPRRRAAPATEGWRASASSAKAPSASSTRARLRASSSTAR